MHLVGGRQYVLPGRTLAVLCTRALLEADQLITPAYLEALRREARPVPRPRVGPLPA